MNVSELQSVQARERQSDSLQELRPSFYRDAADFVAELRDERARVAADAEDPFENPEVTRLTDDIRTAEQTVEAIYERRVGKVVKLASLAAADMPTEREGLTTEEQELFETLVEAIESHRDGVLASLTDDGSSGQSTPGASDPASPASDDRGSEVDAADVMGAEAGVDTGQSTPPDVADGATVDDGPRPETEAGSSPPADESESQRPDESVEPADGGPEADDRTTVRITEDVGAILGVDEREYDLATNDVVALPTENATPLIERDAAEPVD
jgi:DNA replication factor GINS